MKLKWLFFLITILPTSGFAFFCPTNFRQIDYGATIEQVQEQCGKPDKQETKEVKKEGPQEWDYYVPQTVATNAMASVQGTLKTQITFDDKGKAINISVNGIGVGATTICGNTNIQLGTTREAVQAACGKPAFVNKNNDSTNETPPDKITTMNYNGSPPIKLIFQNGILTGKE